MTLILLQKETGSALVFAAFLLVLYREGMSGMILYSGLLAITIFILSIKFGGIMISETTSFGEVSIVVLTLLSGIVMLWMYQPTKGKIRILLLKIIAFFAVVTFLLILTPLKISYAFPGYVCIFICAIILLYYALLDKIRDFALIGLLMACSIAFMFSENFILFR
jgi:rod shape determining protein RodA